MQAGDYAGALPVLEAGGAEAERERRARPRRTRSTTSAATRPALGQCDGVEELLDRSEAIQGERKEIRRVRRECRG